jgi:hypothetical protein
MKQHIDTHASDITATKARQGGPTRVTLWILLASVALSAIVGFMLLTNNDEFPPSTQRNPVEQSPVSGSQSTPPQTRQ